MVKGDFGPHFEWGVSSAAFQTEGAWDAEGKGQSIWDVFTTQKGKIKDAHHARTACNFYQGYQEDIALIRTLNIPNFRFSIAWPRIFPAGVGRPNPKGLDFYSRVVDRCLEQGITPWITLYHWDLPQSLQEKGGWANRDILSWMEDYTAYVIRNLGDRVKHWMVLNEPTVFTGAGYFFGVHAPGLTGLRNFFPAAHHAAMAMGRIGRLMRSEVIDARVGTTFSCSSIHPASNRYRDEKAAVRADALINRLFIEPILGLGYPVSDLKALAGIEKYMQAGDEKALPFDFDFIGIQNYTREVVANSIFVPYLRARLVPPARRNVSNITAMGWEVYPAAIYEMIKKFNSYPNMPKLIVTENGAAFADTVTGGQVKDHDRTQYLKDHLAQVLQAKRDGFNVQGYFVWTLTDNFEWAEGYHARFGLVHVDFDTQQRIVKDSGKWYGRFLSD
ncbi:GH1 family beta-glucosidase [Parapedobacter indicus]|uniref:Beta-glucosidase n=1 Tax=Parapedobacter indicus TaxID=1477437 RepID=A0A1I3SJR5_9SPHI|nr:GH1 family beta-glucosidase [Parapedobacter indicus]PPK99784.1 beta-glucosidase [Parapedobacter indicus]SFJ58935.1 beta-glucosidase [Parapedobacter indicus]